MEAQADPRLGFFVTHGQDGRREAGSGPMLGSVAGSGIERHFADAGVVGLSSDVIARFSAYLEILLRWNARLNLTSIRSPQAIVRRHFAECVLAAQHLPRGTSTLLDFGSGAGFPGIPIAICRPEILITLSESQTKKESFLREIVRALGLSCEIYGGRVDSLPGERLFDAVTMRSVDKMEQAILDARPRAHKTLALITSPSFEHVYEQLAQDFTWAAPIQLSPSGQAVLLLGARS